jgi:predicted DNA-binding protein YlxM (UPF0122 family)
MEKLLEESLLYDFYSELLTDHQRQVYQDFVMGDLSLGEIAQERGISRQGVHDMIKRTRRQLQEYESRLHLVDKFIHIKENAYQINRYTEQILSDPGNTDHVADCVRQIRQLSGLIVDEL